MLCEYCSGKTQTRHERMHHWFRGRLYLVDNVEVEACTECGARYHRARVIKAVDALLARDHPVSEVMQVEVVSMS